MMNGWDGIPLVIQPHAVNNDCKLWTENSLMTTKNGGNTALLGKSMKKHGKSLIDVTSIDAKQKVATSKMNAKQQENGSISCSLNCTAHCTISQEKKGLFRFSMQLKIRRKAR